MASRLLLLALLCWVAPALQAAEEIPPAPTRYFTDQAGVVSPAVAEDLNARLEQFERETSNQILVVIFQKMKSASSIEDYTQRLFSAWKVGQQKLDNGAIFFVFVQDRRMRIHTGYGLEGALPDALCKRILDEQVTPHFKTGDFDAGMRAAVDSVIAATRGEYKGTGKTVREERQQREDDIEGWIILLVFVVIIVIKIVRHRRGTVYGHEGVHPVHTWYFGSGGGSSGGGDWGGGGGFSGGGGDSGGGGASGSW